MIDLSHLTEEEQGAIMTVLRRDVELKKAEEDRIRKLEKIMSGGSLSDTKRKYLTGEWFYEAKSRRHTDKIHGSEIILASMKQRKALDGSLRIGRPKISNSQASHIVAPPKPARRLEALRPQDINDAGKENVSSRIRSPRMPRHNPFDRPSSIVVEPPGNNNDMSTSQAKESTKTEVVSPLKNLVACDSGQTSGGSITSEGSSVGFRPVPRKRTFLSKRSCSQSESNDLGLGTQEGSAVIVPAPRTSLQRGSSGSSNKSATPVSERVSQSAQPSSSADPSSQQTLCDILQVSSNSSPGRVKDPPSSTRDRPPTDTRCDTFTATEHPQKEREKDDSTQRGAEVNTVILPTSNIKDLDRENSSSMVEAMGRKEQSFTHSTVDLEPPVSYDLNFVDKSNQQTLNKSNQKHVFKLSTQASSPTGDEEGSIAKVLDWFSRSTDSNSWLNTKDSPETTRSADKHVEISKLRREDSLRNNAADIISDRQKETLKLKRSHLARQSSEGKEVKGAETPANKGQTETEEDGMKDVVERIQSQEVNSNIDEWQPPKISHLKSFWEKSNTGPKILTSKSIGPSDKEQLPVEKDEKNMNKLHRVYDMPPGICNGKGNNDKYPPNHVDEVLSPQKDIHQEDHLVMNASTQRNSKNQTLNISEFQETPQQEELSESITVSQLDTDVRTSHSPNSEKLHLSRNSPFVHYKHGEDDVQIGHKAKMRRCLSEDAKPKDKGDQPNTSTQRKDASSDDRSNSPHSNSQSLPEESTAEKIKQLKSFWEQERSKPIFYTGKPKPFGDGKADHSADQASLNKRFTKSEYNLRSVGNDSDSDREHSDRSHPNFTVLPLNQRIEKLSPSLGTSRAQFNTLRDFWDEATSDSKDKPKTPKRKKLISAQRSSQELKCDDPEIYYVSSTVEKTRPAAVNSPPPQQIRSKSPHITQRGLSAENDSKKKEFTYSTTELKRSLKDMNRKEKPMKPQSSLGKEICTPKGRKDSFGNSSSSGNSLRRATSMFALSVPRQNDQDQVMTDLSPVQALSRKQRHNTEKSALPRRSSEETETVTPRARAFVPTDYRHYLGMTDKTSVHTSLTPAVRDDGSEGKSGYEFDLSSPVRASTPLSLTELQSKKGQRPLWANYSSSDTGQESSMSSTSETWSISRNSSNRENEDENHHPVKKALRRAEARPKNLTKSMEDITACLPPNQERIQNPNADVRRIGDVSSVASPSSSLFSDPDHIKKMSKSVPSFLQNEDADSSCEDSDHQGKLMMGRSMTNLTNSSGMTSVSSLSGSVMTVYSGDFGNVEVQGNIQFSINYIQRLREFHIFVAACRDLAAVDQKRGRSDPYVKSYLVPDKANLGKRKTSVKKKTLNPTFNEILRYRVRMEYLRTQTLILSAWHHDTFGRNSFLGEVDVDLSNWDFDHTQMNYLDLKARTTAALLSSNERGEMRLAVRFLPEITRSEGPKAGLNSGEIHIWVKECKNLPLIRATIDPYVKCFVLPDTSRKSRQKTRVVRRTVDPVFNHTMVYDGIREADLTEACLELTVWDRDRLGSNLLGGLRLGAGTGKSYGAVVDWMDSTSYEVVLWERMIASPNEWVEGVLPLRILNSAKQFK
ncbi:Synaptotagmin-like protein 2 Exophilin-4 [Channa argus]|uniref:Synaptotagmin-like protein 2 n=1 Tax=Channa argus TaxID=215402 RepID=A0A6G1PRP5_CHAAH|nr:Synaptotagmin-like protein 2 Exophilin-4 [Channa argus]